VNLHLQCLEANHSCIIPVLPKNNLKVMDLSDSMYSFFVVQWKYTPELLTVIK